MDYCEYGECECYNCGGCRLEFPEDSSFYASFKLAEYIDASNQKPLTGEQYHEALAQRGREILA